MWESVSAVATLTASIVAALTLWLLKRQTDTMIKAFKSASYSQIYSRLDAVNAAIMHHVSADKPFASEFVETEPGMAFSDTRTHLCDMIITLYEDAYFQRFKIRLLDKDDGDRWDRSLKATFRIPFLLTYWCRKAHENYPRPFVEHVTEVIGQGPSQAKESK